VEGNSISGKRKTLAVARAGIVKICKICGAKNEIALLSPEDASSAISMSSEPPKRFVRWQPRLVSTKLPIYIPTSNRRSTLPGQHTICFS